MSLSVEIDENDLLDGKYDGLEKINVEVSYVKKLLMDCRKYALRNTALMHDLAEVGADREKLLSALGCKECEGENGSWECVIYDKGVKVRVLVHH